MALDYYHIPLYLSLENGTKKDLAMLLVCGDDRVLLAKAIDRKADENKLFAHIYVTSMDKKECVYSVRVESTDKIMYHIGQYKCKIKDIDEDICDVLVQLKYEKIKDALTVRLDTVDDIGPSDILAKIVKKYTKTAN